MNDLAHKRRQILQQMEQIERMELGSLQSETRPAKGDSTQERGPYHKHQVWAEGKNHTRRVSTDQAPALAEAIAGRKQFEHLAGEFVQTTVALTRLESSPESKKNTMKYKKPSKWKRPDTSKSS